MQTVKTVLIIIFVHKTGLLPVLIKQNLSIITVTNIMKKRSGGNNQDVFG